MSGIIAVYSLVISVLIAQDLNAPSTGQNYSLFKFVHPPLPAIALQGNMLTSSP